MIDKKMKKLILKLIQKCMLEKAKFRDGDLIQTINGDEVFSVVGTYYDFDLEPQLFIMDVQRRIYGVDPLEYKQCTDVEKINSAGY